MIAFLLKKFFLVGHLGGSIIWRPTLAQVVISQFMGSSPAWGSVLTVQCMEPALDSVSPSLSAPHPLVLCLSKINKCKEKNVLNSPLLLYSSYSYIFGFYSSQQAVYFISILEQIVFHLSLSLPEISSQNIMSCGGNTSCLQSCLNNCCYFILILINQ